MSAPVPSSSTEVEICVWVDGCQKWISGVNRRTTCHDVIRALLKSQSPCVSDEEVTRHNIVERWKRVERPLEHEQRILKVWKSWGDMVHSVRFSLRKERSEDTAHARRPPPLGADDCETESCGGRSERSRRRHKMRVSRREATAAATAVDRSGTAKTQSGYASPSLLSEDSDERSCLKPDRTEPPAKGAKEDPRYSETMERLMRLVVAQGETIQNQLKRLNQRETQIETYEQQMHLLRVQNLGTDYLLSSYLQDQSNFVAQNQNVPDPNQVQHPGANLPPKNYGTTSQTDSIALSSLSKVVNSQGRLLNESTKLNPSEGMGGVDYRRNLLPSENSNSSNLTNISEEKSNDSGIVVNDDCLNASDERVFWDKNSTIDKDEVEEQLQMLAKLEDIISKLIHEEEVIQGLSSTVEVVQTQQKLETNELEEDLKRASEDHAILVAEARANEQQIRVLDTSSTQKKKLIDALLQEEIDSDQETRALQAHLDYIIHLPPTAFRLAEEGDDPPPLYPPPVYPMCLVQPLFGHQPPQLVHVNATAHCAKDNQTTKDSIPVKSRDNSPSVNISNSLAQFNQKVNLSVLPANENSKENIPIPKPNLTRVTSVSLPKNGLSVVPIKQQSTAINNKVNSLSYDRHVLNRSSLRNSIKKLTNDPSVNNCSQCSSNANNKMNNLFNKTYLEKNKSNLCVNCSNSKNQLSLLPDDENTSQKSTVYSNHSNNNNKSLKSEQVNNNSSDEDSPPPLPSCPPPMLESPLQNSKQSDSFSKKSNLPITNLSNKHQKSLNNNRINLTPLDSDKSALQPDFFLSTMPSNCRSSTSSDSSTTNSSTSSASNTFVRLAKVPDESSIATKVPIIIANSDNKTNLPTRTKLGGKKEDSVDSNSDTGLSSLHSSSDEGFGTLDTLV